MRRIVLCLDGTWNSTYKKAELENNGEIVKPSNVLKFSRAVLPQDPTKNTTQVVYYDAGVGSMSRFSGYANKILQTADKFLGGVWGAGFESNIEDAATFLVSNHSPGDEVYILGFSRGAATARALTNFIDWMGGIPLKQDAYFLPHLLRAYIKCKGKRSCFMQAYDELNLIHNQKLNDIVPLKITFLGVWDTVLSLGGRIINQSHRKFHLRQTPAFCIRHVRQAIAIDEQRSDFLPSIWTSRATSDQDLKQVYFPGVHANVGGGYRYDGLANGALHWMVAEIDQLKLGLAFDRRFLNFYRAYAQDEIIESKTGFYQFMDAIRRQSGHRHVNSLEQAQLAIHESALQRMLSDPLEVNKDGTVRYKRLVRYRPGQLMTFLASVNNRDDYIDCIEGTNRFNDHDALQRVLMGGEIVFDAKSKKSFTGYQLEYQRQYTVRLEVVSPLYDKHIACDFSGWNVNDLVRHKWFHRLSSQISRFRGANLFTLVGEVAGQQIDLGRLWLAADKSDFGLSLAKLFPKTPVSGPLYVYLNDVMGFYGNNKGSYKLSIQ